MPHASPAPFALDALRLTEAAARAAARHAGRGDKHAVDHAAVEAIEQVLRSVRWRGRVVVGEGEKDDAPLLAPGAEVGAAEGPCFGLVVDPVDGTRLVADGRAGGLSVLALAPRDTLLDLSAAFYLEKIVGPEAARPALDADVFDAPPETVLHAAAEALGRRPGEMTVAVQRRPRHEALVGALRRTGASVRLFRDADLSWAVLAARDDEPVDLLWGVGGAPEGLLAACALRAGGRGTLRARLHPRSDAERTRLDAAGLDVAATWDERALVRSRDVVFALTGVTDGPLVKGVRKVGQDDETASFLSVGRSRAARHVVGRHRRVSE